MMKGVEQFSCEEKLGQLVLFRLKKAWGDSLNVYKYLKGECKEDRARLFSVVPHDGRKGNGHTVKHRRFHVNIRHHYLL